MPSETTEVLLHDELKNPNSLEQSLVGLNTVVDTWMGKGSTTSTISKFAVLPHGILLTIEKIDGREPQPREAEIVIPDHVRVFPQNDGMLFYWHNTHRRIHLKH